MKTFKYSISTPLIWTSFDGGRVEAENLKQASIKAEAELQVQLDNVNAALATNPLTKGISIDMDMDLIEFTEVTSRSKFKEIKTDYEDENGVTHIDGYCTGDDNEEGICIGYFIFNEVYWRDPEFQFDPYVIEVVAELKSGK